VNLSEVFTNLKKVLKWSCLNASEDIMGEPIMSLLMAIYSILGKWSEVSLSSLHLLTEMSVKRDMSSE